ncbi:MAG: hypothetical protein KAI47_14750, partial [Deltaproteobacteria bacterium]|nr:hypothetical protein [Deltaproteobacteria bacterium]
ALSPQTLRVQSAFATNPRRTEHFRGQTRPKALPTVTLGTTLRVQSALATNPPRSERFGGQTHRLSHEDGERMQNQAPRYRHKTTPSFGDRRAALRAALRALAKQ